MFYIYDCSEEEWYTIERYVLYQYVHKFGTCFGNYPKQKRDLEITSQHVAYGFGCEWIEKKGKRPIKYIVHDQFFNLVDYKILEDWALNGKSYRQFDTEQNGDHDFRNGPVRWTGKKVYGYCSCYRSPRTTQELRANCDPDYVDLVRSDRKFLPNVWDDVRRSDIFIKKSWKKCKKKRQWM